MTNVDEWTDFIYVGKQHEIQDSMVAMIICPAENHQGRFGHVVWKGGNSDRLPPEEIKALVKQPWLRATNAPPDQIDLVRTTSDIRIPKHLRVHYQPQTNF
jgi:hypothetical protein